MRRTFEEAYCDRKNHYILKTLFKSLRYLEMFDCKFGLSLRGGRI